MRAFYASIYVPNDSSVHRQDVRSKLIVLAVYSICLFFVDTWAGLAVNTLLFLLVLLASKLPLKKVFLTAVPVYVLVGFTILFNSFQFYGADASGFTYAGFTRGCFFALRILLLVWASLILSFSTTSTELTYAFASLMSPLRKIKVPVDDIAMIFSIALRFIPLMVEEFMAIRDAQWSRGAAFGDGGIIARTRAHCVILLPMVVGLFRRADRLAVAMDSRCYGISGVPRSSLHAHGLTAQAVTVMVLGSAICIGIAALL